MLARLFCLNYIITHTVSHRTQPQPHPPASILLDWLYGTRLRAPFHATQGTPCVVRPCLTRRRRQVPFYRGYSHSEKGLDKVMSDPSEGAAQPTVSILVAEPNENVQRMVHAWLATYVHPYPQPTHPFAPIHTHTHTTLCLCLSIHIPHLQRHSMLLARARRYICRRGWVGVFTRVPMGG